MMKSKKEAHEIARLYNRWIKESYLVKSPRTVESYELTLNLYIRFLTGVKGVNIKSFKVKDCFSRDTIEDWLRWLQENNNCTPQSCNVRLSNLHSFMKYLSVEDYKYTELYITSMTVERRKAPKVKIRGISEAGIEALLNSIDISNEVGLRDCILWQMVYLTGMRISEALSIRLKHLNLNGKKPSVTVVGKRDKIRCPYLPIRLVNNLKGYIRRTFGKDYHDESYLFFSRTKGKLYPMTVKGAEERLKKNAAIAHKTCKDVPLDLHPHMLRHAFASHQLDNGMNIIQLSELLGHEDISTTMRYLDISEKQTEEAIKNLEDDKTRTIKKKWSDNTKLEFEQLFAKSRT